MKKNINKKAKKIMIIMLVMIGTLLTGCNKSDETKKETKVIYVGTNAEYKPYEYLEDGKLVGFDIEFMEAIVDSLGYKIEWKDMSFCMDYYQLFKVKK